MHDNEAPPLRIADVQAMLRRRRTVVLVVGLGVALLVLMAPVVLVPPLYRAEAMLTMDRGLKPVEFQRDPNAGDVTDQLVNTQREMLASRGVLEDALAMSGLRGNPAYSRAADPVALLQSRMRSVAARGAWVITVSLDDEDPIRAERGLQSVLDAFMSHQATVGRERVHGDMAFVEEQVQEAAGKLAALRNVERLFREERAIASTNPDDNHITVRIKALAERQAVIDDQVAALSAKVAQAQSIGAITEKQARLSAYMRLESSSTFTLLGAMQKDLFDLVGQEAELSAKYLDKHPKLIEVRSLLAAKQQQLEETIDALRKSIESEHRAMLQQRDALVQAQESLQRELNRYREGLLALRKLTQEADAQQKVLDELQRRRAEIAATANYDDQRLLITGRPAASALPRRIGTGPIALLAVIVGAAAAVAAAAIADAFDRSIRQPRQIKDITKLRSLGELPWVAGLQPLCATGPSDPPELAEAMRASWTSLRFALPSTTGQVLVVASACESDGRTTISTRLAVAAAMSGMHVLVVDACLERPGLAAQFGLSGGSGLAELLAGVPNIAPVPTSIPNLELLPAGSAASAAGELLHSHCLGEWLAQAREHFDLVIFDVPAFDHSADATLVGAHATAALLVVRSGNTIRDGLAEAWERATPLRPHFVGYCLVLG